MKKQKILFNCPKTLLRIMLLLLAVAVFAFSCANAFVIISASGGVIDFSESVSGNYDCIVVLGAGIKEDGTLSNILHDRVTYGCALYLQGAANRVIVSGDGFGKYDESEKMKEFMVNAGIDESNITADRYGYNTYDTLWRAKNVYGAEKILIVTQDFHIYRSVFIARAIGLDAEGVVCDTPGHATNLWYELRESAARAKYCTDALFPHDATYTGR